MPIGVASISLTCLMPSASIDRMWGGTILAPQSASSAGTRLSRISVVLPDPDTPVITVSAVFGMRTESGKTVWILSVSIRISPFANAFIADAFTAAPFTPAPHSAGLCFPERYLPMTESALPSISSTVPSAMTVPPFAPASGPSSMSQSASFRICVS